MNCKPGDLAMIRAFDDQGPLAYGGRFVTCIKFVGRRIGIPFDDWWLVDRQLGPDHDGYVCDLVLIPIRPSEGQDETLTWAGKPKEVTA